MANGIYVMNDRISKIQLVIFTCWISTVILSDFFLLSDAHPQNGPSPDFRAHTLIKPKILHGRHKREITNTKEDEDKHVELAIINFEMDGAQVILDVTLNRDLVSGDYKHRIQHKDGFTLETPENNEICQYKGTIRGVDNSWVAVSTCSGLRGVIYNGVEMQYLMPMNKTLDGVHYLLKHSDLITNNKTCGYKGANEDIYSLPHASPHSFSRRKRSSEVIRGPYNANRQSRYVELVLVIDKKEYVALGENLDKVHYHCKDIANIINALYTPLNIFVALVGVEVWTDTDQIRLSTKGDMTLSNFLRYRREILVKEIPNDNAQLLTRINFADGVVGKALKGPICTYEFSGGVSMDHSNVIGLVAATVAHEMGHNFGMEHDSDDCFCPEDRCIMAPSSSSTGPTHWSSCSLEYLALAFEHGMDYCLRNKPTKLFDSPMCGNGFVEPGEQCDCGLKENCDNPCCNATTCMLHTNASCATGECCDLKTCRPKTAGSECRSADHECDLPEYCTGQSEYCPVDVFKIDGESCSMGKAFCYQGSCRTHNDQCELLWGPSGLSSDAKCYEMNIKGTKNGNCGYNRLDSSYVKCTDENNLCGMLHCKHLNERLEFGMESVAILSHAFINNGREIIACRSALVDLGLNQVDPGLAPDGAKCAPGKMCVNQKCMPISDLRLLKIGKDACPNNCGDNGICNSLGHCHCYRGFRPPDCVQPGFGGSTDSGPIEDPNARNDIATALYIIFLGIIPTIMMISLIWYRRQNSNRLFWKKDIIPKHNRGFTIKTIDRPMNCRNLNQHQQTSLDTNIIQDSACTSLLPKVQQDSDERFNNNMFGQFKGFTLAPLTSSTTTTSSSSTATTTTVLSSSPGIKTVETVELTCGRGQLIPTVGIKQNQRNNLGKSAFTKNQSFLTAKSSASSNDNININNKTESLLKPISAGLNNETSGKLLISNPILATTTCSSMDLMIKKLPTRPAPEIPVRPPETFARPNSTPLTNVKIIETERKPDKIDKVSGINKIVSILKSNSVLNKSSPPGQIISPVISTPAVISSPITNLKDEKINTLIRNESQHQKANKVIDKEILRNLEISNPILQKEIKISTPVIPIASAVDVEKKNVVMRAQSMRDSKMLTKPSIHTFGSMRQLSFNNNSNKRPTSIPNNNRPTSPPPPVPVASNININKTSTEELKIPGLPGYQNPSITTNKSSSTNINNNSNNNNNNIINDENTYDDCMNLIDNSNNLKKIDEDPHSNDNIYAVIEDTISVSSGANENCKKNVINIGSNEYKIPKSINPTKLSVNDKKTIDGLTSTSSPPPSSSSSTETNIGLLSEIVSEISNRNFDSIYSTSTLVKKKKEAVARGEGGSATEKEEGGSVTRDGGGGKMSDKSAELMGSNSSLGTYANSGHYKSPGSIYSNSTSIKFNSGASETSSGYLLPSAVNVPRLSQSNSANSNKTVVLDDKLKVNTSNLDGKKNVTDKVNSPDVVSSCSSSSSHYSSESPDIVAGGNNSNSKSSSEKPLPPSSSIIKDSKSIIHIKPNSIAAKASTFTTNLKSSNIHSDSSSAPSSSSLITKMMFDDKSKLNKANVASLQKKFEQNKANSVLKKSTVQKSNSVRKNDNVNK